MNPRLIALTLVILAFAALTAQALHVAGYWGILLPNFQSWGAAQVFTDLVILAALACFWMWTDAPRHQLPAWPFILVTVAAGAFGPLFYLLAREWRSRTSGSA